MSLMDSVWTQLCQILWQIPWLESATEFCRSPRLTSQTFNPSPTHLRVRQTQVQMVSGRFAEWSPPDRNKNKQKMDRILFDFDIILKGLIKRATYQQELEF